MKIGQRKTGTPKMNLHKNLDITVVNNENIPVGYVSRNEVCKAFLF